MISINRKNPTPGEITSSLTNASDAAGLHFDGAGFVSCGDSTILDGATRMSMEAIATTTATSLGTILAKRYGTHCYSLGLNAAGNILVYINNGSSTGTATSSGTYNDGNPKHIVVTWDNATVSIYVNGNLDGTATLAGGSLPNTADYLALGVQYNGSIPGNEYFNGIIYRARLFNYVIDPTRFYENSTVPFSDQYGSQTIVIPGDFTGDLDGWDGSNTWNGQTNPSNNMVLAASASPASQYCRTNTTLTSGKRYRVTYTASATTGSPIFAYADGGTITALTATSGSSTISDGTASCEFILPQVGSYFYIAATGTTDAVTLDDVSVVEIGCVADYDCAFSNPEISTMVQDRAGAADGTASSGVTQVTPIEQLNSKSARIGTSAATPDDGEIIASKLNLNADDYHLKLQDGAGQPWYVRAPDDSCRIHRNGTGDVMTFDSAGNVLVGADALLGINTADESDTGSLNLSGGGAFNDARGAGISLAGNEAGNAGLLQLRGGTGSVGGVRMYAAGSEKARLSSTGLAVTGNVTATALATFSNGIAVTNSNNYGVIEHGDTTLSLADDAQIQLDETEAGAMLLHIYEPLSGYGGLVFVTYGGVPIIVADPDGIFSASDTDGKICVISSAASHTVNLKNRLGTMKTFKMLITAGTVG